MFLDSFEILLGILQGIFSRFQGNQGKFQPSQRLKMLDVASLLVKGELLSKYKYSLYNRFLVYFQNVGVTINLVKILLLENHLVRGSP